MQSQNSHRVERVASLIKRAVAVIIESELADPRIVGVSVVDATVSRDLKNATIFVYIDGDEAEVLAALKSSAGYIRKRFAEQNREMRVIPQFKFEVDKTRDYFERIETVIRGLHDGNSK